MNVDTCSVLAQARAEKHAKSFGLVIQGEVRFTMSTGDKKIYMTIASAAKVIKPVIEVCADVFKASDVKVRETPTSFIPLPPSSLMFVALIVMQINIRHLSLPPCPICRTVWYKLYW